MTLTAGDILRHGADTEREKTLIAYIEKLESENSELQEERSALESMECVDCINLKEEIDDNEERIRELERLLDKNGIEYE
jgi:hypothetical protein